LHDRLPQCFAQVMGLDCDAMLISVNNHFGQRVYSAQSAGNSLVAMTAGHAFYGKKMVHGFALLKKISPSIARSLKK
jgi:hypothetical protein